MLRHKNIDRVCCVVLALTLLLSTLFAGAAASGMITEDRTMGYENRLFDTSRVHTIDIVIDEQSLAGGWEAFLDTATAEEYALCHLVIDGEGFKNVGIRGKGNTSLSTVASFGNDRYSFKVEFDHYQSGNTYYGLDKLSLNNLIYDNTYMKDYFAYTLMGQMGVAAPLCSFVQITVNGEPWGLYLAVEGVEEAFLQRNYGKDYGELYKPDSMSFGGGRGNGGGFDMDDFMEQFDSSADREDADAQTIAIPDMVSMPTLGSFDPTQWGGGGVSADESAASSEMPTGGTIPDMGSVPEVSADSAASDASINAAKSGGFDRTQRGGNMGGGFGMGSDDVKLQYIDDDPSSYTNIFNSAKTDVTAEDQTRLIASLKALSEGDVSVVDTDAVIRYMAVHNFLCNEDSYTGTMVHNYYLYEENSVLAMIPWDYNLAYATMTASNATSAVNTDIDTLVSNGGSNDRPMADWITGSEAYMAQYRAMYQEFITSVFDSGWFATEIDRVIDMISPYVEADPTAFCTYEEFQTAAQTLKAFCLKRAESVSNQLRGDDTLVDASELTLSAMGSMSGAMGGGNAGDRNFAGGFGGGAGMFGRSGRSREFSGTSSEAAASEGAASLPTMEIPSNGAGAAPDGASSGMSSNDAASHPTMEIPSNGAGAAPEGASSGMSANDAAPLPTMEIPSNGAETAPEGASSGMSSNDEVPLPTMEIPSNGAETAPDGASSGMSSNDAASLPTMENPSNGAAAIPDNAKVPDGVSSGKGFAGDMSGMTDRNGSNEGWIWVIACTILLCAALIFAKCWRSNR